MWLNNQIIELDEELFGRESRLIKTLKHLNLSRNQIKKLPLSLFNLQNLETLHLSQNQLGFIPYAIEKLTKLKIFAAVDNQLTYLPATILKLPIKAASISRNPLLKISDQLSYFTTKKYVCPSLFDMALSVVMENPSEVEKIPLIIRLTACFKERQTCLCGKKIFVASEKVVMKVSFPNFVPQRFPVELVCCSSRCFLRQKLELMKPDQEASGKRIFELFKHSM